MHENKYIDHEKQKSARNGYHLPKISFKACEVTFIDYICYIYCTYSFICCNMWLNTEKKKSKLNMNSKNRPEMAFIYPKWISKHVK